jgi:hypothetical protein
MPMPLIGEFGQTVKFMIYIQEEASYKKSVTNVDT